VSEILSLQEFPCFYTFKIFGKRSDAFVDQVRAVMSRTLGPVPLDSVKVRESSRGRYQSVTACIWVGNREQLERVYEDLRAEVEVLFFI
jgi:uncharacterized protein